MVSDANQKASEDAGLSFLAARVPGIPCPVARWRREHPGEQMGDGQAFTLRRPAALVDSGRGDQPVTTSSRACKGSTEAGR